MQQTQSKFIGFFDLVEAMKQPGCPVCLQVGRDMHRSMDGFLYESINDPGLRDEIRRDHGLCQRHTWKLVGFGDSLAGAILFSDLLRQTLARLACAPPHHGLWFGTQKWISPPACLFCRTERRSLDGVIRTLVEHFDDPEILAGWSRNATLCVNHLRQVCGNLNDAKARQRLLALHRAKFTSLLNETEQLVRKHSYDHQSEETGDERDSWRRAAAVLVGQPGIP